MVHGFYVIMGGIAFEIPENLPKSKRFLPSHSKEHWIVSGKWIRYLPKEDSAMNVIQNLSENEIKSKSKSSGLAKTLVCIQVLWFIAQCLTRRT